MVVKYEIEKKDVKEIIKKIIEVLCIYPEVKTKLDSLDNMEVVLLSNDIEKAILKIIE